MERIILHIDVNNAFLSWSAVYLLKNGHNIDIRKEVSVIGGDEKQRHGVVLARSELSKKRGIKTGETLLSARKKVNNLKIYPPNFSYYNEMSNKLFNFIKNYTPDIEIISIDECFIDYTKVKNIYGNELQFAKMLQKEIWNNIGITVNIGIGHNKLCAKMASELEKPNKINTLYSDEIKKKLWPLPINELFGVGRSTFKQLKKLNINTIYDLAHANHNQLYPFLKNRTNKLIMNANGIDDEPVDTSRIDPKGISASTTLPYDYENKKEIENVLDALVHRVVTSLRKQGKLTRVVAIFIKNSYFETISKQKKLNNATDLTEEISLLAKQLFNQVWDKEPIRLIGIRLDNLTDQDYYQTSLFEDLTKRENNQKLDQTIDNINDKFGKKLIVKANIIDKKLTK